MLARKGRGQRRYDRKSGWDRTQSQPADQALSEPRGVLLQAGAVRQNPAGPAEHPLSFRREALKPLAPPDDQQAQLFLELFDSAGQRGLGHVAGLRRPTEMLLLGERRQIP